MKAKVVFNVRKQKHFFAKTIQNGWLNKAHFPALPILNIFSENFMDWLVELIDAKSIGVAQLIWLWGFRHKVKNR